jgi:hypothetical protein
VCAQGRCSSRVRHRRYSLLRAPREMQRAGRRRGWPRPSVVFSWPGVVPGSGSVDLVSIWDGVLVSMLVSIWCRCWCRATGRAHSASSSLAAGRSRPRPPPRRARPWRQRSARRSAPRQPRSACLCGPRRPRPTAAERSARRRGALAARGRRVGGSVDDSRSTARWMARWSRAVSIGIDLGEKQGSEVRTGPTCKDVGPHGRAFDGRKCHREVISKHSVEVGGEN